MDTVLQAPIEVDPDKLSKEALRGVIEDYILRSGTDYGSVEVSNEVKVKQVHKQLMQKTVKLVYDPNTESVTLMTERDFKVQLTNLNQAT